MKRIGCFFLAFFTFWTTFTLGFDVVMVRGLYRQSRASGFSSAEGIIKKSEVESHSDSEGGTSYSARIEYDYAVGGVRHSGDQRRFAMGISGGFKRAHDEAAAFPVGTKVNVYYDPGNPETAALERDFRPSDVVSAVFMLPFNAVMLAGIVCAPMLRKSRQAAGGFEPREEGGVFRARMRAPATAWLAGIAVMGAGGFISTFVLLMTPLHDSWPAVLGLWSVCVGGGLLVAGSMLRKIRRGDHDLTLDPIRHILTWRGVEIPFTDIIEVSTPVATTGEDGPSAWKVVLRRKSGEDLRLCRAVQKDRAEAIVNWIKERTRSNPRPESG